MRSEGYAVTADEVKLDRQDLARSNSLTDLAARIRIEHEATAAALQRRVMHAMAAGDLLIEAKAQLKHGQWLPWLAKHCVISERTAQLYVSSPKTHHHREGANPQRCGFDLERGTRFIGSNNYQDRDGAIA